MSAGTSDANSNTGSSHSLDTRELLPVCRPALERKTPVRAVLPIDNTDRAVGTILGHEVSKRYGAEGLPDDTVNLCFKGSAGQSFGAFVPRGITLHLEGDANDYVGKGLSGGKIVVRPSKNAGFTAADNVAVGNMAFYGATCRGSVYSRSGGRTILRSKQRCPASVVEGIGNHGCEYMTGGRVVVLWLCQAKILPPA